MARERRHEVRVAMRRFWRAEHGNVPGLALSFDPKTMEDQTELREAHGPRSGERGYGMSRREATYLASRAR